MKNSQLLRGRKVSSPGYGLSSAPTSALLWLLLWISAIWLPALLPVAGVQVAAQNEEDNAIGLKGLDKSEVLVRFGKPDEQRGEGNREAWLYGKSIIFFESQKVGAWSDSGELRGRENLAAMRDERRSDYELFSRSWVNPWTPRAEIQPEDILAEVISHNSTSEPIGDPQNDAGKEKAGNGSASKNDAALSPR